MFVCRLGAITAALAVDLSLYPRCPHPFGQSKFFPSRLLRSVGHLPTGLLHRLRLHQIRLGAALSCGIEEATALDVI